MQQFVLPLLLLLVFSGCVQDTPAPITTSEPQTVPSPITATTPEPNEVVTNIPTPVEETPTPEVPVAEKTPPQDEMVFIMPELTYVDAYNGPLIDTASQVSGAGVDIDQYMENNNRNGVHAFIGYFGFVGNYSPENLNDYTGPGYMIDALQRYPGRIIPFFTLGFGAQETRQYLGELVTYYEDSYAVSQLIGADTIKGIGEVEEYGFGTKPNSTRLLTLFDWAAAKNLSIMFHPNVGETAEVKALVAHYPNTKFIMHMFPEEFSKDRAALIKVMQEHPNLYFSVDADHMMHDGDTGLLYKYQTNSLSTGVRRFNEDYDRTNKNLLQTALSRYRPLIEAVPDQVMWGTELGTLYGHDPTVYDRIIKFARAFIGELKPEHQEKFAYLNAWNTFGPTPKLSTQFIVQDTSAWPTCTEKQDDGCLDECAEQFPDFETSWEDEAPPNFEGCWDMCTAGLKCKVALEVD